MEHMLTVIKAIKLVLFENCNKNRTIKKQKHAEGLEIICFQATEPRLITNICASKLTKKCQIGLPVLQPK